MKDLQVVAFGMNPLQGSFYGVEASCQQATNKIAAFQGHGYLQLRSSWPAAPASSGATKRDVSLGLSFKTQSPEGVLLYTLPIATVRTVDKLIDLITIVVPR